MTVDRSYVNFSLSKNIDAPLMPFNGSLQGQQRGVGDFNVQVRTLITVRNERFAQVQFDAIANRNLMIVGDRLKLETPRLAG